jgi:hypothetical protein
MGDIGNNMCDGGRKVLLKIPQSISWICIFLLLSFPVSSLDAAGDSKSEGSGFLIRIKDNLLTVKLKDTPLETVLTEIANQTGIQIIFYGPMEGALSADFSALPLDNGLKRLVREFNHVFVYQEGKTKGSEPEIVKIIIYSKMGERPRKGLEARVIEPKKWSPEKLKEVSLDSLLRALEDKDPEVREEAVDFLSGLKDERANVHLAEVLLTDEDKDVRESAAGALGELKDKRAIDPLIEALRDKDAGVRESAADALAEIGGEEVISPLMDALRDENEDVRETAADGLKEITGRHFTY